MYYTRDRGLSLASPFGSLRFMRASGNYIFVPRSDAEARFIESTADFRSGIIQRVDPAPAEPEEPELPGKRLYRRVSVPTVTSAKLALEWLVRHRQVKRAVMNKAEVLDIAERLNVEFPNLKK